ncbi:hypothetical protein EVAR_12709_1 [Eumeta japonica]|uniref:Uncharacterized protein n=1 Tax=Eumeta variegata TaxID=151549 RepID=A0A4C1UMM1_EUMVA|nr:hypothetical protein EVAR_12709_1 [Eumeta japonica]
MLEGGGRSTKCDDARQGAGQELCDEKKAKSRNKRLGELQESKWSRQPLDTRNPEELPVRCRKGVGYTMKEVGSMEGQRGEWVTGTCTFDRLNFHKDEERTQMVLLQKKARTKRLRSESTQVIRFAWVSVPLNFRLRLSCFLARDDPPRTKCPHPRSSVVM